MSKKQINFKPAADLDPNVWYHLTEARVDDPEVKEDNKFGSALVVSNVGTGDLAMMGSDRTDRWQFVPVDTDEHDARYAIRCSKTTIRRQLSVCYREDELAHSKTQPCMLPSDGSEEQKWDVARWDDGTGTFRLINVANGTDYWLDCHQGNPPFMNDQIDTSVNRPAQRWIMSSADAIDDGEYSTTFTNLPTATADVETTATADPTDSPAEESASADSSSSSGSSGLSSGAAAGIGVGAALAVIGLAAALFLFMRRRRRRRNDSAGAELPAGSPSAASAGLQDKAGYYDPHKQQQWSPPPAELGYHEAPQELPGENHHHELSGDQGLGRQR